MFYLGLALRQDPDPDRERHQGNRIRKDREEELQNSVIPYNFSNLKNFKLLFFLALPKFYILNVCHLFACKTGTLCSREIA
jgi:hypothetical protein